MNISRNQAADSILMIKPVSFNYNPETAVNNFYQKAPAERDEGTVQKRALREFEDFVSALTGRGIDVVCAEDTIEPATPDSVFPNNWISFHEDGGVAIYPMFAENRRRERREDILELLEERGFCINRLTDYSRYENLNRFLEGTGSMVLDRVNKKVYCALSPRADQLLLNKFCMDFEYTPIVFTANQWVDKSRLPIYHTNVLMALGRDFAIICSSSIDDPVERNRVLESLREDGKIIVDITEDQVELFAGNALQVRNKSGELFLIMSQTAYDSMGSFQLDIIKESSEVVPVDIHTIQTLGGGSVRCMMAEIFLPKN